MFLIQAEIKLSKNENVEMSFLIEKNYDRMSENWGNGKSNMAFDFFAKKSENIIQINDYIWDHRLIKQ